MRISWMCETCFHHAEGRQPSICFSLFLFPRSRIVGIVIVSLTRQAFSTRSRIRSGQSIALDIKIHVADLKRWALSWCEMTTLRALETFSRPLGFSLPSPCRRLRHGRMFCVHSIWHLASTSNSTLNFFCTQLAKLGASRSITQKL